MVTKSSPRLPRSLANPAVLLASVLVIGLCIRLLLASFGGDLYDVTLMRLWAERLTTEPISRFYAAPYLVDHLPGDMWILKILASIYRGFSPTAPLGGPSFLFLLKVVPAFADVGISLFLYLIVRQLSTLRLGLLASASFLLNPASIFLTSIWGQWDSISCFIMVVAVWAYMRGKPECAFPLLVYATLIKPAFAALIPLYGIALLYDSLGPVISRRALDGDNVSGGELRRLARRVTIAAAGSLGVAAAVMLPFNVGIGPVVGRWSILERLHYALSAHTHVTAGALNIWALRYGIIPHDDGQIVARGVSIRDLGIVLFGISYLGILALYAARPGKIALLWASLLVMFCAFMLPTRVHERYMLPALVLAALLPIISRSRWWVYAMLSSSFLMNLVLVYSLNNVFTESLPRNLVLVFLGGVLVGAGMNLAAFVPLIRAAPGWGRVASEARRLRLQSLPNAAGAEPPCQGCGATPTSSR